MIPKGTGDTAGIIATVVCRMSNVPRQNGSCDTAAYVKEFLQNLETLSELPGLDHIEILTDIPAIQSRSGCSSLSTVYLKDLPDVNLSKLPDCIGLSQIPDPSRVLLVDYLDRSFHDLHEAVASVISRSPQYSDTVYFGAHIVDAAAEPARLQKQNTILDLGQWYLFDNRTVSASTTTFTPVPCGHFTLPANKIMPVSGPASPSQRSLVMGQWPEKISCVIFDFDGVMTDNRVFLNMDGEEFVGCSREDGMGIDILRKKGMPMLVISKEKNAVVSSRCNKLGLPCLQGVDLKIPALKGWLLDNEIDSDNCLYMGNDINDLECLEWAKFAVVPNDAHESVVNLADLVLAKKGGHGAVRQVCDYIVDTYY